MSSYRVSVPYQDPAAAVAPRATKTPARTTGGRLACRLLVCGGLAMAAGGCSMSFPMAGFIDDAAVTGSIPRSDDLLFKALDQEDGRRARAALAVALDPQGNGASVAWSNPQSGAKGNFVAAATPFTEGSHVCRAFRARVEPDVRTARAVAGSACRNAEGEWRVSEAKEVADARDAGEAKLLRKGRG